MPILNLYTRVLRLLGPQARLGWALAVANVALARAQFAAPVLLGRIINSLAQSQGGGPSLSWQNLLPLLAAWVGFGLFMIVCSALVALSADRLAHRRRQAVLTQFFEHVLEFPLSFHGATHSGRLVKVMLSGTDTLWGLWLGFFREDLVALVSILVLVPMSLYLNWRLGLPLIALPRLLHAECLGAASHANSPEVGGALLFGPRRAGLRHARQCRARANFMRVELEARALRDVADRLLGAQIPVLSWWALVSTLSKASTTLTMLAILVLGIVLFSHGQTTVGGIVMFMSFAGMLIQRLEQAAGFTSRIFMDAPRLQEFFGVLDTTSGVRDRPRAVTLRKVCGSVAFERVAFSYDGKKPALDCLTFAAEPGNPSRWSVLPAPVNPRRWRCSIGSMSLNPAPFASTAAIFAA